MSTSGVTTWTATRDQIITRALRIAGAISMGDTPGSDAINNCAEALNAIVKQLQTRGVRLWTCEWLAKYTSNADQIIGTDGKNYTCVKYMASASAGNEPIVGSLWTQYWTLLGASGASWVANLSYNPINAWQTPSNVLEIEKMFIRDTDNDDRQVDRVGWKEYLDIENKYTSNLPTKYVLDKGLTATTVHFNTIPNDSSYTIHYLAITKLEDFSSSADTPDFPTKYIEMLTWALASRLASEKRLPIEERQYIDEQFERYWKYLMMDDNENIDKPVVQNAYEPK
jgi:hypothetical protein